MNPVGLIGPLPPTRSGVATYNLRCIEAAPPLDVFAEVVDRSALPSDRHWSLYPASQLLRRPSMAPQTVISTLGNNAHHRRAHRWITSEGGVAWLHDTSFAGLHHGEAARIGALRDVERYAARQTELNYPGDSNPPRRPLSLQSWAGRSRRWLREVVEASDGLVVHSQRALEIVAADTGVDLPPALIVPLPVPVMPRAPRPDPVSVVSLGFLSPAKLPEVTIAAAAAVAGCSLTWVGDAVGGFSSVTATRDASRHGMGERFTLTGHVDDATYAEHLARAAVAVQLRDLSKWSGEASGAVSEAIGAGVPVITNIPPSNDAMAAAIIAVSPDPTVEEVAAAISAALSPDHDRSAALEFARTYTAEKIIGEVIDFSVNCCER